jgi:predicted nuclease of restriction endonuclease-like (RecB) superfamily
MAEIVPLPADYAAWLAELKTRIHTAQQRATLAVNRELVLLYWQIGRDILDRQGREGWGAKVIERLAQDLRNAFPDMKGFSRANLMYMRAFAEAWPDAEIVQQAVGQLPWGHNLVLLTKLKTPEQRLAYARRAIEHGWSRNVLNIHIERRLLEREGKAITNFDARLPKPHSEVVAEYALRDSSKPIGVAEYQLIEALPADLQTSLPSIEAIERALADHTGSNEG